MEKQTNNLGFSLVEIIVTLAVSIVLIMGVHNLINLSLKVTQTNQMYIEASEIAKQKIETIHSLSYDNVGTVLGNPSGIIPDCETITRKGTYELCTKVEFEDDDYDGLLIDTVPDPIPNDYKLVKVNISWQHQGTTREISMHTKIVPRTQETGEGLGLLRIKVSDTGYLNPSNTIYPIENAKVRIVNQLLGVDVTKVTDATGYINYIATSSELYEIYISHNSAPSNYGTDMTFGTTTDMTPQHLTLYEGQMAYEQFTIDKKGMLNIKTVKANNLPDIWQVNNSNENRLQKNIQVAKDSLNNLYFVWESETSTSTHIYIQKYNSTPTKQWTNDIKLTDTIFQKNPDISVGDNNYSYIVWQDNSIKLKNTAYNPVYRYAKNNKQDLKIIKYKPFFFNSIVDNIKDNISTKFKKTQNKIFEIANSFQNNLFSLFTTKKPIVVKAATSDYYGLKVQRYEGHTSDNGLVVDVFLDEPVDPDHAFLLMQPWWTTAQRCTTFSGGGCCQPDEHQGTAYLDASGMKVTIERSGTSNDDNDGDKEMYFSFYIVEAMNNEFVVRERNSLTIIYSASTTSELIPENFDDPSKLVVFSNSRMEMEYVDNDLDWNYNGYATVHIDQIDDEWKIIANRNSTIDLARYNNTIIYYETVEWLDPLITIQSGEISGNIGTTEGQFSLSSSAEHEPVIMDRTWLYANMRHESNGVSQTSLRTYLIDNNTIGYQRGLGSYESTIRWWTIEFPRGVVVQRGTDSASWGDTVETVDINPVTLEQTWSDSYRSSNSTEKIFPQSRWTEGFSSDTQLRWWRVRDDVAVDFSYQVVDTSNWDRPVEIVASGTQISTLDANTSDNYIGGLFVISKNNFSSNIESITISEHGTVDAENSISNISLDYDIDTTFPYTCDDQTYPGSYQFGTIDTNGFSNENGTSTFTTITPVTVSSNETLCMYVTVDIEEDITKYDTLDIKIDNPQKDIILQTDTGYIKQTDSEKITGNTELLLPPTPEQIHYTWLEDDGDETSATAYMEDTPIVKKPGEPIRIRLSVNNFGSKDLSTTYKLKYGIKNGGSCSSISTWYDLNAGLDWNSYNTTNITDGDPTTDSVNLTNPNNNFLSGYIHDETETTANMNLTHNDFTELEFSIISETTVEDKEYCFRLEEQGANPFIYSIYPEITIIGDYNVFIKKINNSDGSEVWKKQINSNEDPNIDKLGPKIITTDVSGNHYSTVVWYDSNNNIFAQKFDQDGNKLWNSGNDLEIASTTATELSPDIIANSQDDLFITWVSDGKIYLDKYSSTTGATLWGSSVEVSSGSNNSDPEIKIDNNDNTYIVWTNNNFNTYVTKRNASGAEEWSKQTNITDSTYIQTEASIMIDDTNSMAYLSWTDDRLGNQDIYVQKVDITTSNAEWTTDYKINFDTGGDNQQSSTLIMRGSDPVIAWQDANLALGAKFRPEGPTNLIIEPNVELIASGTKLSSKNPITSKIVSNMTTDSTGSLFTIIEHDFDGYYFTATSGQSIIVTDPAMPLQLPPDQIKNIVLYIN